MLRNVDYRIPKEVSLDLDINTTMSLNLTYSKEPQKKLSLQSIPKLAILLVSSGLLLNFWL